MDKTAGKKGLSPQSFYNLYNLMKEGIADTDLVMIRLSDPFLKRRGLEAWVASSLR